MIGSIATDIGAVVVIMDDDNNNPLLLLQQEMDVDDEMQAMVFDSSSDEEGVKKRSYDKRPNKSRDFLAAHQQTIKFYFSGRDSVYSEADFERRFRMPRLVFNRIHDELMGVDPFTQKKDATNKLGISPLVKLVACCRHIAYGDAYDRDDENLQLSESVLASVTKDFCKLIIEKFGQQYLNRTPTVEERKAISSVMTQKGFPGCLGSWDCKHFNWKNCPMRLAGQHKGHAEGGKKTLILEAISDHRKYFWHVNFGDAGSLNDLNVLDKSSIVGSLLSGKLDIRTDPYFINSKERDWMYFLVDAIYPSWSIFVTTYTNPVDPKKKFFAQQQERVRKDIECSFGVLISRFHILERPLRNWYLEDIKNLLHACVIISNMVTEARAGKLTQEEEEAVAASPSGFPLFGRHQVTQEEAASEGVDLWAARVTGFGHAMESVYENGLLKIDLVEHINSFYNRF